MSRPDDDPSFVPDLGKSMNTVEIRMASARLGEAEDNDVAAAAAAAAAASRDQSVLHGTQTHRQRLQHDLVGGDGGGDENKSPSAAGSPSALSPSSRSPGKKKRRSVSYSASTFEAEGTDGSSKPRVIVRPDGQPTSRDLESENRALLKAQDALMRENRRLANETTAARRAAQEATLRSNSLEMDFHALTERLSSMSPSRRDFFASPLITHSAAALHRGSGALLPDEADRSHCTPGGGSSYDGPNPFLDESEDSLQAVAEALFAAGASNKRSNHNNGSNSDASPVPQPVAAVASSKSAGAPLLYQTNNYFQQEDLLRDSSQASESDSNSNSNSNAAQQHHQPQQAVDDRATTTAAAAAAASAGGSPAPATPDRQRVVLSRAVRTMEQQQQLQQQQQQQQRAGTNEASPSPAAASVMSASDILDNTRRELMKSATPDAFGGRLWERTDDVWALKAELETVWNSRRRFDTLLKVALQRLHHEESKNDGHSKTIDSLRRKLDDAAERHRAVEEELSTLRAQNVILREERQFATQLHRQQLDDARREASRSSLAIAAAERGSQENERRRSASLDDNVVANANGGAQSEGYHNASSHYHHHHHQLTTTTTTFVPDDGSSAAARLRQTQLELERLHRRYDALKTRNHFLQQQLNGRKLEAIEDTAHPLFAGRAAAAFRSSPPRLGALTLQLQSSGSVTSSSGGGSAVARCLSTQRLMSSPVGGSTKSVATASPMIQRPPLSVATPGKEA